ncbi:hypothetical protein Ancab_010069 [Ancistrocladus abbreviatus]
MGAEFLELVGGPGFDPKEEDEGDGEEREEEEGEDYGDGGDVKSEINDGYGREDDYHSMTEVAGRRRWCRRLCQCRPWRVCREVIVKCSGDGMCHRKIDERRKSQSDLV